MAKDSELAAAKGLTIASYENCALEYAQSTKPGPGGEDFSALARFVEVAPAGGVVLEIGSGPGWDADWLEHRGVAVRRTDACRAFIEIQAARGASAELLDVVTDELSGPYAGILARHVLQHIERARLPGVFARIASALVDGGALLITLREGQGERVERGSSGNTYYVAEWSRQELEAICGALGLRECWSESSEDADGQWLSILARRAARPR
jgi:hypothetical protein